MSAATAVSQTRSSCHRHPVFLATGASASLAGVAALLQSMAGCAHMLFALAVIAGGVGAIEETIVASPSI